MWTPLLSSASMSEPFDRLDAAISGMAHSGFSHLVRDWPVRTNVLFLDRRALSISLLKWIGLKLRYQYLALAWRRYRNFSAMKRAYT